ncbi:MAG TPA: bifunctional [glutamate--ammonia ligase]-adenylyl-L-tyrosine phosphorylase/[glutamate--ammonia-ligase] adenylyltransferase [Solimonas sp.]|nr:bifunctional [glutamate--ammonia ligase]-adenylyl-L-tyrosine phosphorylase/[glutamate--ammonia-ligase] adenylyltransferase [Solimonas sp.]
MSQALPPKVAEAAPRVFAASRFVESVAAREWSDPATTAALSAHRAEGELHRAVLEAAAACASEHDLSRILRVTRNRELARVAFRDLAGWAGLDETLRDLSDLADGCSEAALRFSVQALRERHGTPRTASGEEVRPVILGMGKLGGRELNFSSDIDLIFCYTDAGETDGPVPLSTDEYFAKLVQQFHRLLTQRTPDGFVYRVDWMLRPFGSAGAPAASFDALEEYYQVHGREWERYALIKARPVAGDLAAGQQLLKALRPFVYRRYLDYNAIGALRELKRLIEDEVSRKGLQDNVKLGAGGIRELEFIVQSFQLVRGGQEAPLRDNRLRPVLRYLGEAGHLPAETARALDADYVFLRRLENALQMHADEQTHRLPDSDSGRAALCAGLGFLDWPTLATQLDEVRARVQREFARVFTGAGRSDKRGAGAVPQALEAIWRGSLDAAAASASLAALGFAEPGPLVEALYGLRDARLVRAMREDAQARLLQLVAGLFEDAPAQPRPQLALMRTLRIVEAVAGRSTYLTLLRESETARGQLLTLCGASPWLADFIAQSPQVLDTLLDPRTLYAPPEREQLFAELAARCQHLAPDDTESAMDLLRRYQKEMTLRIAAADLVHALPLVKVSDRLTWLAEALLAQTLALVSAELRAQFGEARRKDGKPAGIGVIAYGKFGGIEMGYGSDLDIVFLHDCDELDTDTVGGARAVANEVWLSRLAQRVVSWLSAQTPAGRAYEVDMELRPDGRRGLMVTSVPSYEDYQRQSAWTWEHQALTRARFVAGSAAVEAQFARIRNQTLTREREPARLKQDVADMRARMRQSLDKSGAGKWDLKQGEGGLTDCEFITQYLVLRDAHRDAAIVEYSDNWRQLEALERAGSVSAAQKNALIDCYRTYRAWAHQRSLHNEDALADDSQFQQERETIRGLWKEFFFS